MSRISEIDPARAPEAISLVQFHDCSVHYPGTWKMCKKVFCI